MKILWSTHSGALGEPIQTLAYWEAFKMYIDVQMYKCLYIIWNIRFTSSESTYSVLRYYLTVALQPEAFNPDAMVLSACPFRPVRRT